MTLWTLAFVLLRLSLMMSLASCARIMMVSLHGSESTMADYELLAENLAARDHSIVYISSHQFGLYRPLHPNVSHVVLPLKLSSPSIIQSTTTTTVFPFSWWYHAKALASECSDLYNRTEIKNLMGDTQELDVAILDHECLVPFVHSLNASVVFLHRDTLMPHYYYYGREMLFLQRLKKVLIRLWIRLFEEWWYYPAIESAAWETLSMELSPLVAMVKNGLTVNSHGTVLSEAEPSDPLTIDASGMHCRPPKKLPSDVEKLIEVANGFVVVSLNSDLFDQDKNISSKFLYMLIEVFSKLKLTVFWKTDQHVKNCPENVKIVKWLPQQDLLGHPRARALITSTNVLSAQEAIYHGVPIVGLSNGVGEEYQHLELLEQKGMAMLFTLDNISADGLLHGIVSVANDPSFRENAQNLSRIMKDKPEDVLDQVLHRIEHLSRYKDISSLLYMNDELNTLQYYGVDAIVVLFLQTITALIVLSIVVPMTIVTIRGFLKYAVLYV